MIHDLSNEVWWSLHRPEPQNSTRSGAVRLIGFAIFEVWVRRREPRDSDATVTRLPTTARLDSQRKRPWEIYEKWWPKFHPNCHETSWNPSSCFVFISIQPSFVWRNNFLWLNSAMHDYFENLSRFSAAMSRDGLFGHVYCYYLLFLKHVVRIFRNRGNEHII